MHSPDPHDHPLSTSSPANLLPRQADTDEQLVELWLHGRAKHTLRAYARDADRFLDAVGKLLHRVTLGDLQQFSTDLASTGLKPTSIYRILSSVKSLFEFAHRLGYLPFDVARPIRLPGSRDELTERILDEGEVHSMTVLEPTPRNRAILLTLYAGAFRVSELSALTWADLQDRNETGQITVYGKGDRTRSILLPPSVWDVLQGLKGDAGETDPVFRSRKGGHLDESQIWRIVRRASERAGIHKDVSCHWFRHAHASHALDRGAPIHLVQATLGHASISTTSLYLHARPNDSSSNYLPL